MRWNIYYYNVNANRIEIFNIFDHWSFREYTKKAAEQLKTKEEFVEQLIRELRFYFWSKCEWELIVEITEDNRIFLIPWCGCRNPEDVKIDVTDNLDLDWKSFAEFHTNRQIYRNRAKIDVFDQVMMNWDLFIDYCWKNKSELLKENNNV